jgi:hypothetical protein
VAEDFIYPHEFLLLAVWLCAPALALLVAGLLWFFARRGLLRSGKRARAIVGLVVAVIGTLVLSVPLWLTLPASLLGGEISGGLVPPFFVPSFIAALVVAPLVVWFVSAGGRRRVPNA